MDFGLKGKTVVVTGGGSNIGRAIALTFGREGSNVVIAELDEKAAQKVADEIISEGGKAKVIKTDVTNYESVQATIKQTIDEFGQIHVLVNNVGWDDFTPFLETKPKWEKYINLNFRSTLHGVHAVLPHMIEKKYGRIVNIVSDAGRMGEYLESVYAGCKAGVIGMSIAIAREVGRYGITINMVAPGATIPAEAEKETSEYSMFSPKGEVWQRLGKIFTPEAQEALAKRAYPLRRLGRGQDIANAVVFLASEPASYITGQTLSVDGGYYMSV